ncbi:MULTISPECIES: isoprenylcysteine carboxylmethyltransferase family protein [unclassified Sinorhizobium]|uniref:methyltransferase family protein n=1 Tax=unclassified Sinorhizobium TaxID=2613772 RepID=UPI0024C3A424|nr:MULTISPECIES: isoprenylcysteine carboxylmethyltransferase family protein [unclassified Sinorhizobium]MDK1377045.1 isoprenylcysteine carboxylmethyltransferase family protein [Sinorhizobium sp. 6-70]MDK1481875.1 isoprenylcysteine carboxylmethyltransferase family protein [Sinorhizobium sp. 6-117]
MIVRLVVQTVIWLAIIGAVLFASAGTVAWPAGWVFLAVMLAVSLIAGRSLARHDPALLKERLSAPIQKGQPFADKILLTIIFLFLFGSFAFMALDAVRFGWSSVPPWVQGVGALTLLLSIGLNYWTFRENSFAAPVVKVQRERGQRVVTTGPYRYVRHPLYGGGLLYVAGMSLLLGSWWGLVAVVLFALLLAVRIGIEEKVLRTGLAGYDAYAARVRYRLIPYVW